MFSPFKLCDPVARIKCDVSHLFDFYCELRRNKQNPESSRSQNALTTGQSCEIIDSYPPDFKNENALRLLPLYAYPCEIMNPNVRYYSFVILTEESQWLFGYCRHEYDNNSVLMVLSYLPWHDTFKKLLSVIAYLRYKNSPEFISFISNCYRSDVPPSGGEVKVLFEGERVFVFEHPSKYQLASLPENHNLNVFYGVTPPDIMIAIFASMLVERRIIFISRHLDRHSACVQAANALLYPLQWQHTYIPVLPTQQKDFLCSSSPYLIGAPSCIMKLMCDADYKDAVIYNCDTQTYESNYDDVNSMPKSVVMELRKRLQALPKNGGELLSRIFLHVLVELLGRYRYGVEYRERGFYFNLQRFLRSNPLHMRRYLFDFLETSMCYKFIHDRMLMLNNTTIAWDEFELEAVYYEQRLRNHLGCKCIDHRRRLEFANAHFMTPARIKLQDNVLNAIDIAACVKRKINEILKSRKYRRPQKERDQKELLMVLTYWMIVASEAFRDLHEKCMVDMRQLGYVENPMACKYVPPMPPKPIIKSTKPENLCKYAEDAMSQSIHH